MNIYDMRWVSRVGWEGRGREGGRERREECVCRHERRQDGE